MTLPVRQLPATAASLPAILRAVAAEQPHRPAQWYRTGQGYMPVTYEQLDARIRALAAGLVAAGVHAGDRVALLMENRPEWAIIDYAILSIGAVTVPMYTTYRPQDIAYVLDDCGASIAITSGGNLLRHLLTGADEVRGVKKLYALDCGKSRDPRLHPLADLQVINPDTVMLDKRLAVVHRDTLATLVYTSGTTGEPKGVMLTHGNIMANLDMVPDVIDLYADDVLLSFLPLAHALERTGSHFLTYSFGLSVAFAERPDTVGKNLSEARPTLLISVPRMLEVIRSRMLSQADKAPLLRRWMFHRFLALGLAAGKGRLSLFSRLQRRALDRIVGQRIRTRFGGRIRALISGGAPLGKDIAEYFEALGFPILEGYGMTEAAPLISVNPLDRRKTGSVGPAGRNSEVRIAEDGEILVRGPHVMQGYWKQRRQTAEVLAGGWLHTGDVGRLDADGYLSITNRKKDIIVTSGGENVAPQRIEALLVRDAMIEQAVVFGDQKPYLVALVVPSKEACTAWAAEQGLPESDWPHLCASKVLRKMLQTRISGILHPLNAYEQVRRIHLLDSPFSTDNGMLTPTMKVRRRQVLEHYRNTIEELYS